MLPYLSAINTLQDKVASFIGRVPGVAVNTDKWATIERLRPFHNEHISSLGFSPDQLWTAEQVHGSNVAVVTEEHDKTPHMIEGVDGLIAPPNYQGMLGIYVADCAAVWLCDKETGAYALIHSGRKGTEAQISQKTLQKMEDLYGTKAIDVFAAISPCIHPPFFEVDIEKMIVNQLLDSGLLPENIYDFAIDTGSDLKNYYSYRVEKGHTGRMLALLGNK